MKFWGGLYSKWTCFDQTTAHCQKYIFWTIFCVQMFIFPLKGSASASKIVFRNESTTIITIATNSGTYVLNYEGGALFLTATVNFGFTLAGDL